jgi:sterol desaturase/sphingolipid hydroxylase (fatty acid hydroxylase superfamily)
MGPLLAGSALFLLMMAGLFVPLEAFFPAHPGRSTSRAMGLGAGLFVLNGVLMEALGVPVLARLTEATSSLHLPRGVGVTALVFVLSDAVGYGVHRAMHRVPVLWRWHRLHHDAVALSWLDAWRQHPIDFLLHGVAVGVPGALLGASLSQVASVVVLRKAYTTFLHANVRVHFGSLGLLLASPRFHRVHHGAAERDGQTNLAGTFPLWDWLFGTLAHRPGASSNPG